jgi:hypothetical protein
MHPGVLNTLPHRNEMVELVEREPFISIRPLVEDEYDIMESEALLRHIQEPHRHGTWPNHQAYELAEREDQTNA